MCGCECRCGTGRLVRGHECSLGAQAGPAGRTRTDNSRGGIHWACGRNSPRPLHSLNCTKRTLSFSCRWNNEAHLVSCHAPVTQCSLLEQPRISFTVTFRRVHVEHISLQAPRRRQAQPCPILLSRLCWHSCVPWCSRGATVPSGAPLQSHALHDRHARCVAFSCPVASREPRWWHHGRRLRRRADSCWHFHR